MFGTYACCQGLERLISLKTDNSPERLRSRWHGGRGFETVYADGALNGRYTVTAIIGYGPAGRRGEPTPEKPVKPLRAAVARVDLFRLFFAARGKTGANRGQ